MDSVVKSDSTRAQYLWLKSKVRAVLWDWALKPVESNAKDQSEH